MNAFRVRYLIAISVYTLVTAAIVLVQSTGLFTLQIGTASAVLVLPLTIYAGFYFGPLGAAAVGFLAGAATDTYSSPLVFNTLFLTAAGLTAGLLMSHYFNHNFAASVVVNLSGSAIYFFLKWFFIYAFSDPSAGFVLLHFSLPSFIYTGLLGVALFFVFNPILKKVPLRPTK